MNFNFDFNQMVESLNLNPILASLLKALIIVGVVLIGFLIAKLISNLISKGLKRIGTDNIFKKSEVVLSKIIGKIFFYLLMIFVLVGVLEWLGVSYVLSPIVDMTYRCLMFIPSIVMAALIVYLGYILAKIVSDLVGASGEIVEKIADKINLKNSACLVNILRKLVFIFIFVPILIIALDMLNIYAITEPAKGVLQTFMDAIPQIFLAVVIIMVAVFVGRFVVGLLKDLLNSLKVNNLKSTLGLETILGKTDLSALIGGVVYFLIVYVATVQAFEALHLYKISALLEQLLVIFSRIAFGLLILAIGGAVANFAASIYMKGEDANKFIGTVIKTAVLIIFLAVGLNTMGLATEIINLAFGLGIGAIAVAFALSFGLGGRDAAGKELAEFFKKFKKDSK